MGMKPQATVAVCLILMLEACTNKKTSAVSTPEPAAVKAAVLRVETEVFAATTPVTGTLVSKSAVEVKAETTGRVIRFPAQEGDPVNAGSPVLWVDQENYRLAVRQTEAGVRVAEATLARAKVAAEHSIVELERAQNLLASGGITDKDLKAAQVADRDARAQVELANAQLEQARALVHVAQKRAQDTVVRAPVAGIIQKKSINTGAYVEPATAVFTLVDNSKLELEAPVASSDLAPIRAGQRVTFTVNTFPGVQFEGRVSEINPALDSMNRSAKVRVIVDNRSGRLRAGMFVEGEILTGVEQQAVVIPTAAIYRDDRSAKSAYVFVVQNGKAVKRVVRLGRERDARMEISDGLRAGDLLIAEQSIEVGEGVRVEARK